MSEQEKKSFSESVLADLRAGELEKLSAQEILTWGIKNFHPRLSLSCSFGQPEGLVLLDMMHRIEPRTRVFVLDTGRLHQATYDLIDRVRDRYDKEIEVLFPEREAVEELVRNDGMNLFYESVEKRKLCCEVRKVRPLNRYLATLDAWVSGLRRDQNVTRANARKVEIDNAHGGIVKLNPLVDWTRDQVLDYVKHHNVPVNRLHQEGYPSVGCAPCTRAIHDGESIRAGRWWWENAETKECGIHPVEYDGSGI